MTAWKARRRSESSIGNAQPCTASIACIALHSQHSLRSPHSIHRLCAAWAQPSRSLHSLVNSIGCVSLKDFATSLLAYPSFGRSKLSTVGSFHTLLDAFVLFSQAHSTFILSIQFLSCVHSLGTPSCVFSSLALVRNYFLIRKVDFPRSLFSFSLNCIYTCLVDQTWTNTFQV